MAVNEEHLYGEHPLALGHVYRTVADPENNKIPLGTCDVDKLTNWMCDAAGSWHNEELLRVVDTTIQCNTHQMKYMH